MNVLLNSMEDHNESIQVNATVGMEDLYCPNLTEDGKNSFFFFVFFDKTNIGEDLKSTFQIMNFQISRFWWITVIG